MARSFPGSAGNYLRASGVPRGSCPISASAWFKSSTDTTGGGYPNFRRIFSATKGLGENSVELGLYNTKLNAYKWNGADHDCVTSTAYALGSWQHACGVWTATGSAAYLNGGGKGTASTPDVVFNDGPTCVGITLSFTTELGRFEGDIAEVGVWSEALTDEEVAVLSRGVSPMKVRPAALVAYWPLVGRSSPEVGLVTAGISLTVNGASMGTSDHPRVFNPRRATARWHSADAAPGGGFMRLVNGGLTGGRLIGGLAG